MPRTTRSTTSIAIVDVNRLGQRGETMVGWDTRRLRRARRARSAGTRSRSTATTSTRSTRRYARSRRADRQPTAILARTLKGKGVAAVEDTEGWHGKPLDDPEARDRGARRRAATSGSRSRSPSAGAPHVFETGPLELPRYELGEEVATRKAYGEALAALGAARGDVVALDGEVSNSTFAEIFSEGAPGAVLRDVHRRAADGRRRRRPPGARLAAVRVELRGVPLARLRLRPHGRDQPGDVRLSGSHAGVSIGEDGPSQMALEDIAMFRAVHG